MKSCAGWVFVLRGACVALRLLLAFGVVTPTLVCADHYVARTNQPAVPPYTSWDTAASNIQEAVNAATVDGAVVWINPDTYVLPPNPTNFLGTNVVYINHPLTLRGASGEPEDVVINGEGKYRSVAINSAGSSGVPYTFHGLTISNGFTTNNGGGILFGGSTGSWTGRVHRCIISDNVAEGDGGGLYAYWSTAWFSLSLSNSVVRGNQALGTGAGMRFRVNFKPIVIVDSIIEDNLGAGAWGESHAQFQFIRSIIRGNQGIGVYSRTGGTFDMRSSLVYDNNDTGIHLFQGPWKSKRIESSTIVNNGDDGIYVRDTSIVVTNSIIYGNVSGDNVFFHEDEDRTNSVLSYVCVIPTNGLTGSGNITNDPAFADSGAANFRLTLSSPCLNSGLKQDWMDGALDLDGRARVDPLHGVVDRGCYEYPFVGTTIMVQ